MRERKAAKRFRTIGIITVAAVYFLIMVGGVVRSTGAGMGCPDWPKCFGYWVPPTSVSQLPANYQQIYADRGYGSTEFNPVKTWIEYANRLVGVLIGFFIFLTLVFSLPYLRFDPPVFYLSLLSFLLVGFQGWLGSKVVATNLMPLMISLHMVVALLLVGILIYTVARSQREEFVQDPYAEVPGFYLVLWIAAICSVVQILLGIQVREAIDTIAETLGQGARAEWVDRIGTHVLPAQIVLDCAVAGQYLAGEQDQKDARCISPESSDLDAGNNRGRDHGRHRPGILRAAGLFAAGAPVTGYPAHRGTVSGADQILLRYRCACCAAGGSIVKICTHLTQLLPGPDLGSLMLTAKSLYQLSKFRLSFTVAFSSAVGYLLGVKGPVEWYAVAAVMVGGFLVTVSANIINQVKEVELDKLMKRTASRPLPTGRMSVAEAVVACIASGVIGLGLLAVVFNPLAAVLSLVSLILYGFVYTPMKRVSAISVAIGAVPGALPPLIGYVAATGQLTPEGWILFGIQFIWQFPHFWAIAWVLDDDYKRAGFRMLPFNGSKDMRTAIQIMSYTMLLIPLSLLPLKFGMTGVNSAIIAVVCGVLFLAQTFYLMQTCSKKAAMNIMFGSFLYLPIVQIAFVLDKV